MAHSHETVFEALKTALVRSAEHHLGATGWMVLNEAGDRRFRFYG